MRDKQRAAQNFGLICSFGLTLICIGLSFWNLDYYVDTCHRVRRELNAVVYPLGYDEHSEVQTAFCEMDVTTMQMHVARAYDNWLMQQLIIISGWLFIGGIFLLAREMIMINELEYRVISALREYRRERQVIDENE
jgi:hypothetical protein